MSIFDGISNVRKPEVTMNSGPLPTSGPPYFPGARINYAADLLGDHIDAYSYGEADHVSNQTSYLNIAHRIQKIVPQLNLPNASSEGTFQLSHAVDVGDIGFVLRIDRRGSVVPNINAFDRLQLSRMVDPMVNLVTVNYILAGLQRHWSNRDAVNWQQLMVDLRFVEDVYANRSAFDVGDAIRFVSDTARPFGVPHTSELQGGQHEGGSGPVTYPVNFISTFFVSGLTRNICNIWSQHNISAGDDLIFRLEKLPISARDGSIKYHLNHWKKSTIIQQFRYEDGGVNEAWQLVPAVLSTYTPPRIVEGYDYRENGYWHICRSQVMFRNESSSDRRYTDAPNSGIYHDDRASMRGALIEATFEPAWVEYIPWAQPRGAKRQADEEPGPQVYYQGGGGKGNAFLGAQVMEVGTKPRVRFTGSGVSGQRSVSDGMDVGAPPFDQTSYGMDAANQAMTSGEISRPGTAGGGSLHVAGSRPSTAGSTGIEAEVEDVVNTLIDKAAEDAAGLESKMPPPSSKKPRRTLGLAVGLGGSGSVVVHNVKGT